MDMTTSPSPMPSSHAGSMPGMDMDHGSMSPESMSPGSMSPGADSMSGADSMPGMDSMSGMDSGSMSGMGSMGPDIFPTWVSVIWIVLLAGVIAFHCIHLARMGGQHRWFHSAHVVMSLGMIWMFGMMSLSWDAIPSSALVGLYCLTTAAILVWMVLRFARREPFSFLWILALVQQAAMIYMFAPMSIWNPLLSYGLAAYFLLETIAWIVGLCDDGKAGRGFAFGPGDRSKAMALGHGDALGNASMAVMAASMFYMFLGMQLMM